MFVRVISYEKVLLSFQMANENLGLFYFILIKCNKKD